MQIDFHHAVTYICARLAGFPAAEANIIAHSAQYVDDATAGGEIWFDNGMIFPRLASAHKMLDYKNVDELANHRVWLPFHFLPGNNHEAGYHSAHADRYPRRFVHEGTKVVEVGDGFPRLIPGNVPDGIRQVIYEIDLDRAPGGDSGVVGALRKTGAL